MMRDDVIIAGRLSSVLTDRLLRAGHDLKDYAFHVTHKPAADNIIEKGFMGCTYRDEKNNSLSGVCFGDHRWAEWATRRLLIISPKPCIYGFGVAILHVPSVAEILDLSPDGEAIDDRRYVRPETEDKRYVMARVKTKRNAIGMPVREKPNREEKPKEKMNWRDSWDIAGAFAVKGSLPNKLIAMATISDIPNKRDFESVDQAISDAIRLPKEFSATQDFTL